MSSTIQFNDIIFNNDNSSLDTFLDENKEKIDCKDKNGQTPLIKAIHKDKKDIVRALLRHGANVNLPDLLQNTPLHTAIKKNFVDIAVILVEEGGDLKIKNIHGKTPLQLSTDATLAEALHDAENKRMTAATTSAAATAAADEKDIDIIQIYDHVSHNPSEINRKSKNEEKKTTSAILSSSSLRIKNSNDDEPSMPVCRIHSSSDMIASILGDAREKRTVELTDNDKKDSKDTDEVGKTKVIPVPAKTSRRHRSMKKLGENNFTIEYNGTEVRMMRRSDSFNSKVTKPVPASTTPIPVIAVINEPSFSKPKIGEVSAFKELSDSSDSEENIVVRKEISSKSLEDSSDHSSYVPDKNTDDDDAEEEYVPFSWEAVAAKLAQGCTADEVSAYPLTPTLEDSNMLAALERIREGDSGGDTISNVNAVSDLHRYSVKQALSELPRSNSILALTIPKLKMAPSQPLSGSRSGSGTILSLDNIRESTRSLSLSLSRGDRKVGVLIEDMANNAKDDDEKSKASSRSDTMASVRSDYAAGKILIVLGLLPKNLLANNFPSLHCAILANKAQYHLDEFSKAGAVQVTVKLSRDRCALLGEYDMLVMLHKKARDFFLIPKTVMSFEDMLSNTSENLEGLTALVLEKVEMSLEAFLLSTRDVGVGGFKARLAVAYRMMDIVRAAHQNGLVLGDVQLSSFVVTVDKVGSSPVIKYGGLDAAIRIGTPLEPVFKGCTRNIAPELASGRAKVAHPSQDIWALGITLVQVLASSAGVSFWSFTTSITAADIINKYLRKISSPWIDQQLLRLFGDLFRTEYGILLKALLHYDPSRRVPLDQLCEDFNELQVLVSDFRFSLSFGYNSYLTDALALSDSQLDSKSLRTCKNYHDVEHVAPSTLQTHIEYQLRIPLTVLSSRNQSVPSHFLIIPIEAPSLLAQIQKKLHIPRISYSKVEDTVTKGMKWDTGKMVMIAIDANSGRYMTYGKTTGFEFSLATLKEGKTEGSGWDQFLEKFKSVLAYSSTQLSILLRLFPSLTLEELVPPQYMPFLAGLTLREFEMELITKFESLQYKYIDSLYVELSASYRRSMCMKIDGVSVESRYATFVACMQKLGYKHALLKRR